MKIFILLLLPFFLFANDIKVEKISLNLNVIWGMTFVNNDKLLLAQKNGQISFLDLKTKKVKNIYRVKDVYYNGQAGLFDIQKASNGYIYITYAKKFKGNGVTTLARAKFKNEKIVNFEDLLVTKSLSNTARHFGSRIAFDEDNHLYFSIGDRGIRSSAQNLKSHSGTILRLNLDGTIPKDNPFVDDKNALREIYSYGHRNPQGMFYDKNSKKLFSIEHGPRGGDEINIIKKAVNYGWPIVSYGKEYWNPTYVGESRSKKGFEDAIKVYTPSIAPSSLIVYSGKLFKQWSGNIFAGALKLRHLNQIILDKNGKVVKEDRLFENLGERIRNVIESPKGELILSTDSGNIYIVYK